MSTVFLIILAVQRDVMRRKLQNRIPNRFWNLWMLIVDLELMKRKIGDLRGYDFEEEKVPAEEIKIDFWGVFRAETPLISPI